MVTLKPASVGIPNTQVQPAQVQQPTIKEQPVEQTRKPLPTDGQTTGPMLCDAQVPATAGEGAKASAAAGRPAIDTRTSPLFIREAAKSVEEKGLNTGHRTKWYPANFAAAARETVDGLDLDKLSRPATGSADVYPGQLQYISGGFSPASYQKEFRFHLNLLDEQKLHYSTVSVEFDKGLLRFCNEGEKDYHVVDAAKARGLLHLMGDAKPDGHPVGMALRDALRTMLEDVSAGRQATPVSKKTIDVLAAND